MINLLGVKSEQPSWGKYIINPWAKFKSGFFLPQEILFTHSKKFMGLKKADLNLSQGWITSPSRLLTILPRKSLITFAPKETIDQKKRERERERE